MRYLHVRVTVATVLLAAVSVIGGSPADADDGDIALSVLRQSQSEIQVAVCLSSAAVDQLPLNPVIEYEVTSPGMPGVSATWSYEDPEAAVLNVNPCPAEFVSFAIECLAPGTAYTFTAKATLTPRLGNEVAVDDPDRPVRTATASVTATTLGDAGPPGCPSADGGEGGATGPGPTGPGSTGGESTDPESTGGESTGGAVNVTASSGVTSDASADGSDGTQPLVIPRPDEFRPAQFAALSPAEVASIEPATFGQLPPAVFTALKPAQAAMLTPEQASRIRPARAARLGPAAVAALSVDAVKVLRPAAVKFLSPATVSAMTRAQLRALSPRQVAALRPKQLAVLTAGKKALLRSPLAD